MPKPQTIPGGYGASAGPAVTIKPGADPTFDATSIKARDVPLPKSAPVRGGAQDTGGPPIAYGPTLEREN